MRRGRRIGFAEAALVEWAAEVVEDYLRLLERLDTHAPQLLPPEPAPPPSSRFEHPDVVDGVHALRELALEARCAL